MPHFVAKVKNSKGKTEEIRLSGDSYDDVLLRMQEQGHIVIDIKDASESRRAGKGKYRHEDILMFTRLLSTIVRANIPLVTGLEMIGRQVTSPAFLQMIHSIGKSLREGLSLSEAMAEYPAAFNSLYLNMIRAGEITGKMSEILPNLFQYLKKSHSLRKKIVAALMYPSIIFAISITIAAFFVFFLIPQVEEMFSSFNQQMPPITVFVLDFSRFFRGHAVLISGVCIALVMGFIAFKRTETGAFFLDKFYLKLPVIGDLLVKIYMVRFSYTFAVLYGNEVAILEALNIVAGAMGNRYYQQAIREAASDIEVGIRIEDAFSARKVFPDMVIQMISIGEASRRVDEMLMEVANFYDSEVDVALETMTGVIQPLAIVFLGIFIAITLLALFLPIFNLSGIVQ